MAPALGTTPLASAALLFVELLAASIWVGGMVAIAVVASVTRRTLDEAARVAFFRELGRLYGIVGGAALAIALAVGAILLADRPWDAAATAATVTAALLVAVTLAGVRQARAMTRVRHAAVQLPRDVALAARVARGARLALVLRAAIAVLSLALLALGAALAA